MQLSKILITGGGGFIGSHLAEEMVKRKSDVTVMDRFSVIGYDNIKTIYNNVDIIDADIRDYTKLSCIQDKFDAVFHLAALASPQACEKDKEAAFATNVAGTFNVLKMTKETESRRVVFPSSAQLYGKEPKYLPIDENHPIDVYSSTYNITKRIGERICEDFRTFHGVDTRVVRLFNTFGPKQDRDYFIPTTIIQALVRKRIELWNSRPTRDFNYVSNTVDALIKVGEHDGNLETMNIGYGREIPISELAHKIAMYFKVEVSFLDKPVIGSLRLKCDNSKIRNALNWQPEVSFEEGIDKTIKYYESLRSFETAAQQTP